MRMFDWLLELLFPAKCVLCGKLLKNPEKDLCHSCRTDIPDYPEGKRKLRFLDSFAAVWYYEGSVRRSLLRFKFYNARSYANVYGRLLAMKLIQRYPEEFDILTWVPVSRTRKFRRGYDQVELIAGALGKELDMIPVPLLKKIHNNHQQSRIAGEAERRANVMGAYRVTDVRMVRGKRVLLLDDIVTTGATASECARVLLTAGAKEVHCAAVAAARK